MMPSFFGNDSMSACEMLPTYEIESFHTGNLFENIKILVYLFQNLQVQARLRAVENIIKLMQYF